MKGRVLKGKGLVTREAVGALVAAARRTPISYFLLKKSGLPLR